MIALGIDTGGTYTDSAIVDISSKEILDTGKKLTTRQDFTEGILNAIDHFDQDLLRKIELVSISTTLATNAMVEGKRSEVLTIASAPEWSSKNLENQIPAEHSLKVKGGHSPNGDEITPLETEKIKKFIKNFERDVEGIAISSYFSPRNPEHEKKIEKIVKEYMQLPVVCGHHLSRDLGFSERTSTAIINASLIPKITDWMEDVKRALKEKGIDVPLMIVRGDGSIIGKEAAKKRPVETVVSGPVSSVSGATFLTEEKDAWVIDIGGTTTDIARVKDGHVKIRERGARLGGWKTKIRTADILTIGLGGDSKVYGYENEVILSSERVIPLSLASKLGLNVKETLRNSDKYETKFPSEHSRNFEPAMLTDLVKEADEKQVKSIYELAKEKEELPYLLLRDLKEKSKDFEYIGFTPTDALHCLGKFQGFDTEAAKMGAKLLTNSLKIESIEKLSNEIINNFTKKITKNLIKKALEGEIGYISDEIAQLLTSKQFKSLKIETELLNPIIGIGAPVEQYLPPVAKELKSKAIFPEKSEVGNAIGAAAGNIVEKAEILIRPTKSTDEEVILFSPEKRMEMENLEKATTYGKKLLKNFLIEKLENEGADTSTANISIQVKDKKVSDANYVSDLLNRNIEAKAIARPKLGRQLK